MKKMKLMFLYETLHENDKEQIDEEIENRLKEMILNNRGFNYTESQFQTLLYEIVIHGEQVNNFLGGNDLASFSLKESVVKSRAIKIAYDLEQYRPSKDLLEFYVELCKDLDIEPITDALFDERFASKVVHSLSNHRSKIKRDILINNKKHVDNQQKTSYSKSNKIILFESLVEDFYKDTNQNSKLCSSY